MVWMAALIAVPAAAQSPELWVVNGGSRHIAVVNPDSEVELTTINLDDLAPPPYCVAFSSIAGSVGDYAFVSQGPFIRVIDTNSRQIVRTVDIGSHLGDPVSLRGCSGARPRSFLDAGSSPLIRSFLHVAAQVEIAPGRWQPWFVVLDEFALALAPIGTDPVVAADPLVPLPPMAEREAMDVVVLPTPQGPLFQRAWYTVRETLPLATAFAVQVSSRRMLSLPWTVEKVRATPSAGGASVPDALGVHAPFSRELPGLAEGTTRQVVNLDTEGSCEVGLVPRTLALAGVGPGDYTLLVADKVDDGVPGALHRVNGRTCAIEDTVATGEDPVDLVTIGPIDWRKAFVANRESDTLTVYRSDGTTGTIPIDAPGALTASTSSTCTTCPQSMGMGLNSETACTVENTTVNLANGSADIRLDWDAVGCEAGTWFEVWCTCSATSTNCPTGCGVQSEPCSGGSFEGCGTHITDGGWEPLGLTLDLFYTHIGAGSGDGVSYSVEPDDNQPP